MHPWTLAAGTLSQVIGPPSRALRSRERRLESCYASAIPFGTLVVFDSGSETGVASRVHVWPDAVSLTAHSPLTSAYIHNQVRYPNLRAVRLRDRRLQGARRRRKNRGDAVTRGPEPPFRSAA